MVRKFGKILLVCVALAVALPGLSRAALAVPEYAGRSAEDVPNLQEDSLDNYRYSKDPPDLASSTSSDNFFARALTSGVAWIFDRIAGGLRWLTGTQPIDQLVFGVPPKEGPQDPDDWVGSTFTRSEWGNMVMPWYNRFLKLGLLACFVQTIMVFVGFQALQGSMNPQKAVAIQTAAWNIVTAVILVATGPFFLKVLLELNSALVSFIYSFLCARVGIDTSIMGDQLIESIQSGSAIIDALARLLVAGLGLYFNLLYLMRKWVLMVSLILLPIVAWTWVFKGTRTPILLLISELASNALTPAAHAIVLALWLNIASATNNVSGMLTTWWARIAALFFIIPLSAFIKRLITGWLNLLGVDEEKWAAVATAGIGGMLGLASVISSVGPKAAGSSFVREAIRRSAVTSGSGDGGGGGAPAGPAVSSTSAPSAVGAVSGAASGLTSTAMLQEAVAQMPHTGVRIRGSAPDDMRITDPPPSPWWQTMAEGAAKFGHHAGRLSYALGSVVGLGVAGGRYQHEVASAAQSLVSMPLATPLAAINTARDVRDFVHTARQRARAWFNSGGYREIGPTPSEET